MSRILEKMMIMMSDGLISTLIIYFFAKNFSQIARLIKELLAKIILANLT